jgi:NADPH:quinone reductase-like Zn-dependent oxidoreductase
VKAARISDYNADLLVEGVQTPEIGADEVLVRVTAASLNPLDIQLRRGFLRKFFPLSFPYVLGTDLAGSVVRAGRNVARWREGDKVVARLDPTRGGALAEFAAVSADELVDAPATLPLEPAAGIPTSAGTSWQALFEIAGLRAGQTILVHGGAGGVGSFAIQFARSVGARVIATASGAGMEIARRLGADVVIDYRLANFAEKVSDADVVLDTVGGDTQQRSFGVLRPGGMLVSTAARPDEAFAKTHRVAATFVFHTSRADRLRQVVEALDAGALTVLVDRQLALQDLGDAFRHLESGHAHGKIIVAF